MRRGGDGRAARFDGGWLTVVNSANDALTVRGNALTICFEPFEGEMAGPVLRYGAEKTEILYDHAARVLRFMGAAPLELTPGGSLKLRVFVDGLVVDVFANNRVCITHRIYPENPESMQFALVARGSRATARKVDAWKLESIWSDQKPPATRRKRDE